ncbi:MAG TPA: FAD-binding oxidoreductase [Steroidobacteraceae bacterium]|jgi:FAD/FMN-containing dehydrogenase|nr:FAD-binding oxidoreductase [Steroidobacteraceae bacterium]
MEHDVGATAGILRKQIKGSVLQSDDPGYGQARAVWNGAIDRRPAAIIQCADAQDVMRAVRVASDHGHKLTVRGGGHNVAGRSIADGVLMLDLSALRTVRVSSTDRVALVQGGALWSDVDAATGEVGLATTGGFVSTTGVGGLTLGGGVGWLMRRHGLASDNLRRASVVLSDGRSVRASRAEHEDLFWGLRGGAGGLGVVTEFEFDLHPVREVLAGVMIYSAFDMLRVLQAFRAYVPEAPDELCAICVFCHAPPLPFLDASHHGRPVLILAVCWCGDPSQGPQALEPLRAGLEPLAAHVGVMPYVQWQRMQDPGAPRGRHHYWKSLNFNSLTDAALERLVRASGEFPSPETEIHLQHLGGVLARSAADTSAFASRHAPFFANIVGCSATREGFEHSRVFVRQLDSDLARGAMPTLQPNFADQDDADATRRFGAAGARRLAQLKERYDPTETFAA